MENQLLEKFVQLQLINLNEEQRKFLRLIKERGVCIHMTEETSNNQEFQELTNLLSQMHKDGVIPNFEIVE